METVGSTGAKRHAGNGIAEPIAPHRAERCCDGPAYVEAEAARATTWRPRLSLRASGRCAQVAPSTASVVKPSRRAAAASRSSSVTKSSEDGKPSAATIAAAS
jgi:hypothetical protein